MADLESRIYASHIKWINYLWHHPDSILARIFLLATKQRDMRISILAKTDWSTQLDPSFSFLRQIFHTWAKFHTAEPSTTQQVCNEVIWNNDFLELEGRFQASHNWKQARITYVKDLLHSSEPRFLTYEEANLKYGMKVTFLEVLQFRAIIPGKWKRLITTSVYSDQRPMPTMKTADKLQDETQEATAKKLSVST